MLLYKLIVKFWGLIIWCTFYTIKKKGGRVELLTLRVEEKLSFFWALIIGGS